MKEINSKNFTITDEHFAFYAVLSQPEHYELSAGNYVYKQISNGIFNLTLFMQQSLVSQMAFFETEEREIGWRNASDISSNYFMKTLGHEGNVIEIPFLDHAIEGGSELEPFAQKLIFAPIFRNEEDTEQVIITAVFSELAEENFKVYTTPAFVFTDLENKLWGLDIATLFQKIQILAIVLRKSILNIIQSYR